jgi:uncharacterized protein (DUF1684 family)
MKNIRKFSKSKHAKPTKYLSMLILSFICQISIAQSDYNKEIKAHREKYKADFISDENSPLKKADIQYLDFFEANESYKVKCKFILGGKSDPFEIPTSNGQTKTYTRFGQLKFKIAGKKQKLTVYRSLVLMKNPLYKDYLFIPFKDKTSGRSTYGGGRYLDLRMADLNADNIFLDFNKAYNPYCAFSTGYSCPIPPEENNLKISIEAGERNFLKSH